MSGTETETWRDLTLSLRRGQWHLAIEAPGLFSATAESGSKASVLAVAEACAAEKARPAVSA